jgi:deaminated glutathione amidase
VNGREPTVAAIQMSYIPNMYENLVTAEHLVHAAATPGAELLVLPELWSRHGLEAPLVHNTA